jgi:hypothetical protein
MAVTMADITKLRKMSGAGMMDCKKALTETDGDIEKAIVFVHHFPQGFEIPVAGIFVIFFAYTTCQGCQYNYNSYI